jgi:hypothetical protein
MTTPKIDPRFPDRPQHPDFWTLSRIINELDDLAETKGWLVATSTVPVDIESMVYMARQRAAMALDLLKGSDDTERMGLLWMDAFILGVRYGMESTTVEQVLDQTVDGNRRRGEVK